MAAAAKVLCSYLKSRSLMVCLKLKISPATILVYKYLMVDGALFLIDLTTSLLCEILDNWV